MAGKPEDVAKSAPAPWFRSISEGYFRAVGVTIARGRDFAETDDAAHPAVALVNEAFERRHFPAGTAVGRTLEASDAANWWGADEGLPMRFEIVGVVRDVRFLGLDREPEPAYYLSTRQFPIEDMGLVVRSGGEPAPLVSALRRTLAGLDPELPMTDVATLPAVYREALAPALLNTRLMAAFGAAAWAWRCSASTACCPTS